MRARIELDSRLGETLDGVGDDVGLAGLDRLEQVGVGHEADPLVPRVVRRREVGVDLVLRQVLGELAQQSSTDPVGVGAGLAIHVLAEAPVLLAGEFERQAIGQHLPKGVRDRILRRRRHDPGWCALHHGHVLGPVGHGRNEGHRRGARPDDRNPLAGVVEIFGPFLGVDDLAAERVGAGELGGEASAVRVVPGAHEHEVGCDLERVVTVIDRECPSPVAP